MPELSAALKSSKGFIPVSVEHWSPLSTANWEAYMDRLDIIQENSLAKGHESSIHGEEDDEQEVDPVIVRLLVRERQMSIALNDFLRTRVAS